MFSQVGVVVGSWAGGVPQKPIGGGSYVRYTRAGVVNSRRRAGPLTPNPIRHHRNHPAILGNQSVSRTISRNTFGVAKVNKNRTRKNRTKDKKSTTTTVAASGSSADEETAPNDEDKVVLKVKKAGTDQNNDDKTTKTDNSVDSGLSNGYVYCVDMNQGSHRGKFIYEKIFLQNARNGNVTTESDFLISY